MQAEGRKSRGEATAPLPIPSVAPKRRYEATPSTIVPRPIAPHGDLIAEADEARFGSKNKGLAMSPQPMPLAGRPIMENERSSNRYPPLAQASTTAPGGTPLGDDASRGMRPSAQSHRRPGPPLGFFTDERRESSMLAHTTARSQDLPISSRHTPGGSLAPELTRMDSFMSAQQPPSLLPPSHSRHPSLAQNPGSPTQLSRSEADIPSSVHRDPFGQRGSYYSIPGQPTGHSQSPRPVLSPVKDSGSRASATPAPESAPRQVPAKRSNIMSILNDEPEEPQPPRKRFASEAPTALASGPIPASRSVYQPGASSRVDESPIPGAGETSAYGPSSQYSTPSRPYAEYAGNFGPTRGTGPPSNNDWMARFDPRAQQTAPQPQSQAPQPSQQGSRSAVSVGPQSSYPHYASTVSQSGHLNNLPVPSTAPTPPPASQRPYSTVFSQPASAQAPVSSSSRDLLAQSSAYRPVSPPSRAASVAFGSRQEPPTPAQSSASLYGMHTRQPSGQSFSPATPSTPAPAQHSQSYQQHVQTLVNGSHNSHRSTSVSLSNTHPSYGHSTPPPQNGRSMPSLPSIPRSYTPPSAMHHSAASGSVGYVPPPSAPPGVMSTPLHQRPPGSGSLADPASTPGHHRVYSQGSTQSGLPGSLHPSSQPPR